MKIFILAFILFATLLKLNAAPHQFDKRVTDFYDCSDDFYDCSDGIPGLDVVMTPDPLVAGQVASFKVSGTLNNDIPSGADLRIRFYDPTGQELIAYPYYQNFNESFPAQTTFSITAPKVDVPSNLTSKYFIEVVIEHQILLDIYACSMADGKN
ncbi:hypothetical protein C2G38_2172279 [Gigaspora rosea]|uniref:MD-2-related lipid-recognition domain-containing protein n=1 Tax=Gigaspora rosea TaxID=44941 RepID=A0A397VSX8_9GLOM|nr:hypothetical protein C2G38_2172279 [Gigaspora rosea]